MLALVPCLRCSRASKKCWVGVNSKKCAYCTENIVLCTVNLDKYDNAKTIVAGFAFEFSRFKKLSIDICPEHSHLFARLPGRGAKKPLKKKPRGCMR